MEFAEGDEAKGGKKAASSRAAGDEGTSSEDDSVQTSDDSGDEKKVPSTRGVELATARPCHTPRGPGKASPVASPRLHVATCLIFPPLTCLALDRTAGRQALGRHPRDAWRGGALRSLPRALAVHRLAAAYGIPGPSCISP